MPCFSSREHSLDKGVSMHCIQLLIYAGWHNVLIWIISHMSCLSQVTCLSKYRLATTCRKSRVCQIKQNYVQMYQNGPLNNFNVLKKNDLKTNNFKRFTVWTGLSPRIKFPHKMKIKNCFPRIKFLYSRCKI